MGYYPLLMKEYSLCFKFQKIYFFNNTDVIKNYIVYPKINNSFKNIRQAMPVVCKSRMLWREC